MLKPKLNIKKDIYTLPSSTYSSIQPYQAEQVKKLLSELFDTEKVTKILDATSHIGGDTFIFSEIFPNARITAIDIDPIAVLCLLKNMNKKNIKNIDVIHDDCVSWLENHDEKFDFCYFDPPWGGPLYTKAPEIDLFLSNKNISEIVNMLFIRNITRNVILKIPKNFAYERFIKNIDSGLCIQYDIIKPKKENFIAYKLLYIRI